MSANEQQETRPAKQQRMDPFSKEAVAMYLEKWEQERLVSEDPKALRDANDLYGQIAEVMRKIGERCARRLSSATRNRCAICMRPLDPRGNMHQVSMFDPRTGNHVNQYACRQSCYEKLQDKANRQALRLQAEG
jgi:hypothetical protein